MQFFLLNIHSTAKVKNKLNIFLEETFLSTHNNSLINRRNKKNFFASAHRHQ